MLPQLNSKQWFQHLLPSLDETGYQFQIYTRTPRPPCIHSSVSSSLVERWCGGRQGGWWWYRGALQGRHQRRDIRQDGCGAPSGCHWGTSESPRRISCITMRQLSECTELMEQQVSAGRLRETFRGLKGKEQGVQGACAFDGFHSLWWKSHL